MFLKEWKGNLRGLIYIFHSTSLNCILEVKSLGNVNRLLVQILIPFYENSL